MPRTCIVCGAWFTGPHYEYGCFICQQRALRHGLSDQTSIRLKKHLSSNFGHSWLAVFSYQDLRNYGAEVLHALSS